MSYEDKLSTTMAQVMKEVKRKGVIHAWTLDAQRTYRTLARLRPEHVMFEEIPDEDISAAVFFVRPIARLVLRR